MFCQKADKFMDFVSKVNHAALSLSLAPQIAMILIQKAAPK
jgi:hypothetical protein